MPSLSMANCRFSTPYAAKTDADGRITLRGAPAGAASPTVWHPNLRGQAQARPITVAQAGSRQSVTLPLRAAPLR